MVTQAIGFDWLERARPDMKSQPAYADPLFRKTPQEIIGEMKSGCWGSNRTAFFGIYGLVPLYVIFVWCPLDVWRQRHGPALFQYFVDMSIPG